MTLYLFPVDYYYSLAGKKIAFRGEERGWKNNMTSPSAGKRRMDTDVVKL